MTFSFSPIRPDSTKGAQLYFSLNDLSAAYGELEIDITIGNPSKVTVYLAGQLADTPLDPRITFADIDLTAGITYVNPGTNLALVDVDNVLFDSH